MIPVHHIAWLSILLFATGLYLVLAQRHAILMLIGIELILNAANLLLAAPHAPAPEGATFALFVIIIAVCEAAVGIAIIWLAYRHFQTVEPDHVSELKDTF